MLLILLSNRASWQAKGGPITFPMLRADPLPILSLSFVHLPLNFIF